MRVFESAKQTQGILFSSQHVLFIFSSMCVPSRVLLLYQLNADTLGAQQAGWIQW